MSLPSSRFIDNLVASFRNLPSTFTTQSYKRPAKSLEDLLDKAFFKQHPASQSHLSDDLIKNWKSLLGEFLADRTQPYKLLNNGHLIIKCNSAAIRTEIMFQKKIILQKIQRLSPTKTITDLIIQ